MAYSERIKNFEKIREYMRQFYVYGFKSRSEYDRRSARSYDNERRRIESWLADYISFRSERDGKRVFLSVDSRGIRSNPLYQAFKAKSFTDGVIVFHFFIMDMLADGSRLSLAEIMERLTADYFREEEKVPEESMVRKRIKGYIELGLIGEEKRGRECVYYRMEPDTVPEGFREAVSFFSEAGVLGVVGSYLLDKYEEVPDIFRYKHHYLMQALDSIVLEDILTALRARKNIQLLFVGRRSEAVHEETVFPVKIYVSVQSGREYVLGWSRKFEGFRFFRIDNIRGVKVLGEETEYEALMARYEVFRRHAWGVSVNRRRDAEPERLSMTVEAAEDEPFIVQRLLRERRNGQVETIDATHYRYTIETYDCMELLPWLRTFIGRITELSCSNDEVVKLFREDLARMCETYGGEKDALS